MSSEIVGQLLLGNVLGAALSMTSDIYEISNLGKIRDGLLYDILEASSGYPMLLKYGKYSNILSKHGALFTGLSSGTHAADLKESIEKKIGEFTNSTGTSFTGSGKVFAASETDPKVNAAAEAVNSIYKNNEELQAQATVVTDSLSSAAGEISDIYAELFVNQTTAIRVKLADYEDTALQKLAATFSANSLADLLAGRLAINVDLVDKDTTSIIDTIMQIRGR